VYWPGIAQVISGQYTLSHGISPGGAALVILPQASVGDIALQGNLVFSDGVGTVTLRNCKVTAIRETLDSGGRTWTVEILDRRWRWRDAPGYVRGCHNVPDASRDVTRRDVESGAYLAPAQLYVPWTVKTPHQLIKLCLDAMGETGYRIDAPNTLYPLPAINWDYSNPAQSLSSLVETLGCRIVYRPDTDTVWITRVGVGGGLPDEDVVRYSPSVQAPSKPDTIVLVGAPVKFQVEWLLEAVAEDWDGRIKPIEALSYAPEMHTARHRVHITPSGLAIAATLVVTITIGDVVREAPFNTASALVPSAVDGLVDSLNAALAGLGFTVVAEDTGLYVIVIGPVSGAGFTTATAVVAGTGKLKWQLITRGASIKGRWISSGPPTFGDVSAVEGRLTYAEARDMAQRWVYRTYRILNVNIENGLPQANIPMYGLLDMEAGIHRVVLLNEQIDQTLPVSADQQITGRDGFDITRDFYNGLFKVKPARCYGVYQQQDVGLRRLDDKSHQSVITDEVLVDFSINAERKLVTFSESMHRHVNGGYFLPAEIRLRCACHIRDAETNQLLRYVNTYTMPGPKLGTMPAVIRHDDVEYLVKAIYDATVGVNLSIAQVEMRYTISDTVTNLGEVLERAEYYLRAAAAKYQTPLSAERLYNGIKLIFCDGAIQQVSWSVGPGGAETTASLNMEHVIYVPQYPERLRIEYLQAAVKQAEPVLTAAQMANPMPGRSGPGPAPYSPGGF